MTVTIPMWLVWTLGILGGAVLLMLVGAVLLFAYMGLEMARAVGRGLNW